jgi:hypothetical protein
MTGSWFYQEFDSDDECVVDEDRLTGLDKGKLLDRLLKTNAPAAHLERIALDCDPNP